MFYERANGYQSFSHHTRTFATGLWPILPLRKQLLINRNCSFWWNETLDIIGWWRKFIKVIFFAMIFCFFFFLLGKKWKFSLQRKTIFCKFSTFKFYKRNVRSQIHCFYRKHLSNSWGKTNKQTFLINMCCISTQ